MRFRGVSFGVTEALKEQRGVLVLGEYLADIVGHLCGQVQVSVLCGVGRIYSDFRKVWISIGAITWVEFRFECAGKCSVRNPMEMRVALVNYCRWWGDARRLLTPLIVHRRNE